MLIRNDITAVMPELARLRRALHTMPEPSFGEHDTSRFVYDYLQTLSPDKLEHVAGTGVKAVFYAENAVRTTAFRADMDALPVTEKTGLECASKNAGYMHACGHDAHMATLLMTGALVARNRQRLKENVVLMFQPAEEGLAGAAAMIRGGALEDPHIDRIFGFHVMPGIPVGSIGVREGALMARATSLDITITGKSAHGAKPHLGRDALVAAAQLVTMLETLISRRVDPMDDAVLTIGSIHGGVKRNIICESVKLECTMRTFTDETYNTMMTGIRDMLAGLERAFDVKAELYIEGEDYPFVDNNAELAREFRDAVDDAAVDTPRVCIGEDFSFYQRKTRGLFVFLGVGEEVTALHTPTMFFDEGALAYALEAYMRLLRL